MAAVRNTSSATAPYRKTFVFHSHAYQKPPNFDTIFYDGVLFLNSEVDATVNKVAKFPYNKASRGGTFYTMGATQKFSTPGSACTAAAKSDWYASCKITLPGNYIGKTTLQGYIDLR